MLRNKERRKPGRFHTSRLMHRLGLNTREESIAAIAASDPNFLFTDQTRFDLSVFYKEPQAIVCPEDQTGVLNLMKFLDNIITGLETVEITEQNITAIGNLKRSLIVLLIEGNDTIGERVYLEDYSSTVVDESDPSVVHDFDVFLSIDTTIFEAILRCCLYLQCYYNFSQFNCAENFPYIIDNLLIPQTLDETPIFEYNIQELMYCFNVIIWDEHKLRYDEQLVLYLDLLLTRFAILYWIPTPRSQIPEEMFHQFSILVKDPNSEIEAYTPTLNVARDLCWSYRSFWKKLELTVQINSHRGSNDLRQIPLFTDRQKETLCKRLYVCDSRGDCIGNFRSFVLQSLVRPGERHHYLGTRPNAQTRIDLVLKSREGDEKLIERWMEILAQPTCDIAKDPELFDECVSDWALVELFRYYIESEGSIERIDNYFWTYFSIVDLESELETQLDRPYPMLLQNFNWYGIYYKTRFYSHERAADAILHWLYLVWENSLPLDGEKFFATAVINNLQLRAYDFPSCQFRPVE